MELISITEIIGTVAFAMSGALVAIDKELDYYGIGFFAIITSIGGGIVRDLLINKNLPSSLANPTYLIISIISAAFVIMFYTRIIRLSKILQIFDAIGLGAFTAIGAQVATSNGWEQPFVIITLAVLTGTGGGVLRDIFSQEIPFVFRKEIYAVASIAGAVAYILSYRTLGNELARYICFAVTTMIRLFSIKNKIHLKKVAKV